MPRSRSQSRSEGGKASPPTMPLVIEAIEMPVSAAFSTRIFKKLGVPM